MKLLYLSLVVMKALDKEPDCRYANMELFAEDLGRVLEGRAPLARLNAKANAQQNSRVSLLRRMSSSLSAVLWNREQSVTDPYATKKGKPEPD